MTKDGFFWPRKNSQEKSFPFTAKDSSILRVFEFSGSLAPVVPPDRYVKKFLIYRNFVFKYIFRISPQSSPRPQRFYNTIRLMSSLNKPSLKFIIRPALLLNNFINMLINVLH